MSNIYILAINFLKYFEKKLTEVKYYDHKQKCLKEAKTNYFAFQFKYNRIKIT